ncbi:hypothetical protein TrVFT333_009765 [Trichoderma virens FT-333]|nr:hypothetical protein TrVFT333_009765 [Trichoderma virens FT-333]
MTQADRRVSSRLVSSLRCAELPYFQDFDRSRRTTAEGPPPRTDRRQEEEKTWKGQRTLRSDPRASPDPLALSGITARGPGRKTAEDHTVGDFWELDDGPGDVRTLAGLNPCPGGLENDFSPYRRFRMR